MIIMQTHAGIMIKFLFNDKKYYIIFIKEMTSPLSLTGGWRRTYKIQSILLLDINMCILMFFKSF